MGSGWDTETGARGWCQDAWEHEEAAKHRGRRNRGTGSWFWGRGAQVGELAQVVGPAAKHYDPTTHLHPHPPRRLRPQAPGR